MTFTVRRGKDSVTIPIYDESLDMNHSYLIPPRCEVIRRVQLVKDSYVDQVIFKDEISLGVFIASAIVNPNNCYIRILNANSQPVSIKKTLKLTSEPLENFNILKSNNSDSNRSQNC